MVDADISAGTDLLGKYVADLQEDIEVSNGYIEGKLLWVDDYSSAGYTGDEVEGNFLVIHCATVEEGTTITVEVVGGVHGPSTLDADGLCICRIANTNQKIRVVASKDGYSDTIKEYRLTHLTLNSDE